MSTGFYLLAIEIICILRQPYLLYFFGLLLLSWQNKRRSQKPYFLFHRALFFREAGFPVSALFFYFYFYFFYFRCIPIPHQGRFCTRWIVVEPRFDVELLCTVTTWPHLRWDFTFYDPKMDGLGIFTRSLYRCPGCLPPHFLGFDTCTRTLRSPFVHER